MQLRFDTYTKDADAACKAFNQLSAWTSNLTLSTGWQENTFNLHGDISSEHVDVLTSLFDDNLWNEDASEL